MEDSYLTIILAAFLSTVVLFFLRRLINRLKGKVGERVVSRKLAKLPDDRYVVLDDITVLTPRGSSQIDQLVISVYGIFVIETKNYTGWIYGSEGAEYWTQNIYGNKSKLYNPILQNEGHVRALRRVLKEFEPLPYFPIVAFSERADIKVKVKNACVVYWGEVADVIGRYDRELLSWEQVTAVRDAILSAKLEPGRQTDRQHIDNVRKARSRKLD